MKKFTLNSSLKKIVVVAAFLGIAESVFTYSSGPPAGYTNAPGGGNCTSCHSGSAITSGTVWSGITLTRTGGLSSVLPNASNTLTLNLASPTSTTFGFQLLVLPNSANSSSASIGTFSAGSNTDVQTTSSTSPTRSYLMHTTAGTSASSGSKSYTFNWNTPISFSGGATFYLAFNEANGNSSSSGDNIYVKTFSVTVLPVKWLDFNAFASDRGVKLQWSTAQEINNQKFEVQRSFDGTNFESIGSVKGMGNTELKSYYTFMDEELPQSEVMYRIKQVDFDGKEDYSKTISFDPNQINEPEIHVLSNEKMLWFSQSEKVKNVNVYGLNGALISTFTSVQNGLLSLTHLQDGLYVIELTTDEGKQTLKKVLLQ
ncbi:MAG: T9SS type A sorting domain-containing protein [bacterium]|nr:T9SS type A sorting domain-containing protein [bacterium]